MPALLAFAPAILQLLLYVIKFVVDKIGTNEQKAKFFPIWLEMARVLNLKGIVARYEAAENQLEANQDAWDKIEAEEAAKKKKGKK